MAGDIPETRKVPLAQLASDVLGRGGTFTFVATGGSMWPHIRDGDLVTVQPPGSGERFPVGRVILYHTPAGKVSVHRVIGGACGVIAVRGDSQAGRPERVRPDDILGIAILRERKGRTVNLTGRYRNLEAVLIARGGAPRIYATRLIRRLFRAVRHPAVS